MDGTWERQSNQVAYIFDARGNGKGGVSPTITGDHQNRITDYTAIVLEVRGDTKPMILVVRDEEDGD